MTPTPKASRSTERLTWRREAPSAALQKVARAVAQLRREIMLRGQTAGGLVDVVGRAMEFGGDPMAMVHQLEALSAVDLTSARSYLSHLLEVGPVRAEVRP